MTTKITVKVDGKADLLTSAKAVQSEQRQKDRQKKEDKKEDKKIGEIQTKEEEEEEDEYKGAVADPESKKKRGNKPKNKRIGHWLFWDYTYQPFCPNATAGDFAGAKNFAGRHLAASDKAQISIGSGNGKSWATHVVDGPGGKPSFCSSEVYGVVNYIGYLHYVQYYTGAFGTVYQLPEGATVVPYDPAVYLGGANGGGNCPNDFCWPLYFPDELNSGPGRTRKLVPLGYQDMLASGTNERGTNHYYLGLPVNNKTSIIVGKTNLYWNLNKATVVKAPYPYNLVVDPQDSTKMNITYRVYYKYPGGPSTGWQPITGFYWLMDPSDNDVIMTGARLGEVHPGSNEITSSAAYHSELWGFVVSNKKARKLNSLPSKVEDLINNRCPDASLNYYFSNNPRYTYPMWDLGNGANLPDSAFVLGYRDFPYQADIAGWGCNADAQCMGWSKNLLGYYYTDHDNMPYDFWYIGTEGITEGAEVPPLNYIQGITPGAYDYMIDGKLNDHYFYNHLGRGSWRSDWGVSWDVGPLKSRFGKLRLLTPERTKDGWFEWLHNSINEVQYGVYGLAPQMQLSWLWVSNEDRDNCLEEYMQTLYKGNATIYGYPSQYEDPAFASAIDQSRDYFMSAPEGNRKFTFLEYRSPAEDSKKTDLLSGGVKWISEGGTGLWSFYDKPLFDYDSDPFYDPPYLTPLSLYKDEFKRYRFYIELAKDRLWPPSVTAGIDKPFVFNPTENTPDELIVHDLTKKTKHPIYQGYPQMHLIVNTAWDNNYNDQLKNLGFKGEDLIP